MTAGGGWGGVCTSSLDLQTNCRQRKLAGYLLSIIYYLLSIQALKPNYHMSSAWCSRLDKTECCLLRYEAMDMDTTPHIFSFIKNIWFPSFSALGGEFSETSKTRRLHLRILCDMNAKKIVDQCRYAKSCLFVDIIEVFWFLVWYECMRMGYVGQPSHHHVCCLEERASCCCLQVIRGFSSHHHHQPQSWLLIGGDLGPVEASLVSDWPRRRGETGKLVLVSVP